MSDEPRPYTREEIREQFLDHLHGMVHSWATDPDVDLTTEGRLNGLIHSVLVLLDGCAMGLPAFHLIPAPHPYDRQYHQDEGEDWYPDPPPGVAELSIEAGEMLHEWWYHPPKKASA